MATGSVPITAGSGTPVRTTSNSAVDGGAYQQLMTLAAGDASLGAVARHDPDGTLQVSPEASPLFLDDFSGTLSATHTVGGTAPTNAGGIVTGNAGTTASAVSYMRSVPSFLLRAGSYLRNAWNAKVDTGAVTNSTRWWGYGLNQASPTSAAPVLNGVVFEVAAADGLLYAVAYANGTRTQIAALTRPTDGMYHRYEIWFRQSALYWLIDGQLSASISTTSSSFPQLTQIQGLATIFGIANAATAPTSAPVLQATSVTMTDQSGFHRGIGDGAAPWVMATVKLGSTAIAAADQPLAVGLHPSSPLPAGTNTLGRVQVTDGTNVPAVKAASTAVAATDTALSVGLHPSSPLPAGTNTLGSVATLGQVSGTSASKFATVTTATAFTLVVKATNGALHELTISNPTATAAYVKLYDATTVTAGSGTPVATFRLAATGSVGDTVNPFLGPNGKRFTAGIALAVTGAAVATDATATVAGIQLSGTYV